ncbi:hypothetical protein N7478_001859 [Penicillium angulare]|uniref:uncharacterized protein n=1 Tax=Penicillium angulare TaxID=116970 RepID=UPI0025405901|nr:uncharacterized protein N7478_001859 [Penicillium angulare]KAJ5288829.1 hypothetical protein N7478_001859 [Penicillium angulare]
MKIPSDPKIDGFDILQTPYKRIGENDIRCDVLVPRTSFQGKRPVIIRWHGGGLVTGDSLLMTIWVPWLSDLALKHEAIIISPNYRIMPEATSTQIYEDVEDLWKWIHSSTLPNLLASHSTPTQINLSRIMTVGESAGGSLSLYLALSHPDQIRAATASYPGVDYTAPAYTVPRNGPVWGHNAPVSVFEEIDKTAVIGSGVSSIVGPERLAFMISVFQHGKFGEVYMRGSEGVEGEVLFPLVRLEKTRRVPRGGIVVLQGREDSLILASETEKFVKRARELTSEEDITFVMREGEEHGFDIKVGLDEVWLQDSLKRAVDTWLE